MATRPLDLSQERQRGREKRRKEREGRAGGWGSSHREKDTEAGRNGRKAETKEIRVKGQRRHKQGTPERATEGKIL